MENAADLMREFECQRANSKSELSQLLFISIRQRELVKNPVAVMNQLDSIEELYDIYSEEEDTLMMS